MTATLLDGRALAKNLRADVHMRGSVLRAHGISPKLAIVLVGNDESSLTYVRSLEKTGASSAVDVVTVEMPPLCSEAELKSRLRELGTDASIHGIILQQPLPKHLSIKRIADAIPVEKDVDAANPTNQGRLAFGSGTHFVPATPAAVMLLLERSPAWPLRGKRALMIGRSGVVGLPVALLMLQENATVSIAHSATADLAALGREADVVVVATGRPRMVTGAMLAPGTTVIDVGTNVVEGKLVGDVDFASASEVVGAITPVPGGVGPVTNVALMRNVVSAAESAAHR